MKSVASKRSPRRTLVLPAPPPRKERSAEDTKKRILEASLVEFAAKGKDGARLASIAKAARVQSALIHHYFEDKEGLYRSVIERSLTSMADEVWALLATAEVSLAKARGRKRIPREELLTLIESFVEAMLRFFTTHGSVLALLRHEGTEGTLVSELVKQTITPLFLAIVARIQELQQTGAARDDFEASHLCLSVMAMVSFPIQERPLVEALWPGGWNEARANNERKREIVHMVMALIAS
jgi:AcrR family transcriptional regulator